MTFALIFMMQVEYYFSLLEIHVTTICFGLALKFHRPQINFP